MPTGHLHGEHPMPATLADSGSGRPIRPGSEQARAPSEDHHATPAAQGDRPERGRRLEASSRTQNDNVANSRTDVRAGMTTPADIGAASRDRLTTRGGGEGPDHQRVRDGGPARGGNERALAREERRCPDLPGRRPRRLQGGPGGLALPSHGVCAAVCRPSGLGPPFGERGSAHRGLRGALGRERPSPR